MRYRNHSISENISFLSKIMKLYQKRLKEIEAYLDKRPKDWGKFQHEFNEDLNSIFRNIMDFEKSSFAENNEVDVYKLKQIFIERFKSYFERGVYCEWSIRKPYGYSGDFKIIDDIYQNNPTTLGFERLFDNYFQMSKISIAVRNRKEDFKRIIAGFIKNRNSSPVKIMNLASGPCRDIKELLSDNPAFNKNVTFDCYEHDEHAISYANKLLSGYSNINFIKENAIRIALKKDIHAMIDKKYDLIFSTGLFDYFSERVAIALIKNLKKLLVPKGVMIISNVRDKYSNPSVHFMEWVGDWNLVYRDDDDFKKIFLDAGFQDDEIETQYEQQGIMEYIFAHNK